MTTILAVRTTDENALVKIADTQITVYEPKKGRDEPVEKYSGSKIAYGSSWSIGWAGTYNRYLKQYWNILTTKSRDDEVRKELEIALQNYEKSLSKEKKFDGPMFERAIYINRMAAKDDPELDESNEFILAVNKPSLEIYRVDGYGNLIPPSKDSEIDYVCIGSGTDKVKEFFKKLEQKYPKEVKNVTIANARKFAYDAMLEAEKDISTGGSIDCIILIKNEIIDVGKTLRDDLEKTTKTTLAGIDEMLERKLNPS